MIIRCINNTGSSLRIFEYSEIYNQDIFGRFGASAKSNYPIVVGKEYLVMGLIVYKDHQGYLIDDEGFIACCPCQLFEIIVPKVNLNWHFRLVEKDENIYPFVQAIFGYPELCSDKHAYENLIVDIDHDTQRTYFRRKIELEKELED
ncbi:hypothetical protein BWD42_12955 [Sphingobacterium sp. CZ-UAM]|uniref:hypothetical protein n=1 Tax=Sphingobacterium sp. CZ-UAM TaxID=1933868 RepID=UPI000986B5FF|nr:hypothetical protein [Sphingobacterium sp. CZ-UAM]OOG18170.1 hypothetical protein BWD42_12955 [Sphingobacterium sp. CZ-UAM]